MEEINPNALHMLVKAYREQNIIRWDHFIRCRLTSGRGQFINHDLNKQQQQNMPERNNYRGKKLVIIIWNYIIKIWGIRNEEAQQAI